MTKFQLLMGNPAVALSQAGFIKKALPGAKKTRKLFKGQRKNQILSRKVTFFVKMTTYNLDETTEF